MKSKFVFLALATVLLSGCTLLPSREPAATDISTPASPTTSTKMDSGVESDYQYEQSQTTSSGNDIDSLEKDLNQTLIQDEDLSDILGE